MRERFSEILGFRAPSFHFPIIKIAGTNGKGSISAMLSAVFTHSKMKVGLFTSPHLIRVTERFRVGDKEIEEAELEQIAQHVEQQVLEFIRIKGVHFTPSFFEVLILIALEWFERNKVELAIFEAGIGGRSDAVSLLPDLIAAITSVGKDHIKKLGPTTAHIALDKAGIVKPGSFLLVNEKIAPELKLVLRNYCDKNQTLFLESQRFVQSFNTHLGGSDLILFWQGQSYPLHIPLIGTFQEDNLNLAVSLLTILVEKKLLAFHPDLQGLEKSHWPGRMELIKKEPLIILDAAHNEPALKVLLQTLNQWSQKEERVLIFGCSNEKDYPAMVQLATQLAKDIFLVDDFWHAWPAPLLSRELEQYPVEIRTANTLEAVQLACQLFPQKLIIITGSIFMIGNARKELLQQ